jgi:hypothetical protein
MTKRYRNLMGQSIMDIPETRGLLETRHIDTREKTSKQTNMQHRLSTTMNGPNSLLQVMQGIDLSKDNITISTRGLTRDLSSF